MIVYITYVKVGHRQTPYKQNAPPEMVGRFALGSSFRRRPESVRLRRRTNSTVKVRVGVSQDSVAEGNCVIARWGGEQPEANWQSVIK